MGRGWGLCPRGTSSCSELIGDKESKAHGLSWAPHGHSTQPEHVGLLTHVQTGKTRQEAARASPSPLTRAPCLPQEAEVGGGRGGAGGGSGRRGRGRGLRGRGGARAPRLRRPGPRIPVSPQGPAAAGVPRRRRAPGSGRPGAPGGWPGPPRRGCPRSATAAAARPRGLDIRGAVQAGGPRVLTGCGQSLPGGQAFSWKPRCGVVYVGGTGWPVNACMWGHEGEVQGAPSAPEDKQRDRAREGVLSRGTGPGKGRAPGRGSVGLMGVAGRRAGAGAQGRRVRGLIRGVESGLLSLWLWRGG